MLPIPTATPAKAAYADKLVKTSGEKVCYVRLKRPLDVARKVVKERFFVASMPDGGGQLFTVASGWYVVKMSVARFLRDFKQIDNDPASPHAFDICSRERAEELDNTEREEAIRAGLAAPMIGVDRARDLRAGSGTPEGMGRIRLEDVTKRVAAGDLAGLRAQMASLQELVLTMAAQLRDESGQRVAGAAIGRAAAMAPLAVSAADAPDDLTEAPEPDLADSTGLAPADPVPDYADLDDEADDGALVARPAEAPARRQRGDLAAPEVAVTSVRDGAPVRSHGPR